MATRTAATPPAAPLKNTRWEAFVHHLLEGMPQGRAYERAGYKARGNAAEVKASALVRNGQVADRLAYLKQEAADRAGITATDVLRILAGIAKGETLAPRAAPGLGLIDAEPDHGDRVRAADLLAKHFGLYAPDRVRVTLDKAPEDMTDEELEEVLANAAAPRHAR